MLGRLSVKGVACATVIFVLLISISNGSPIGSFGAFGKVEIWVEPGTEPNILRETGGEGQGSVEDAGGLEGSTKNAAYSHYWGSLEKGGVGLHASTERAPTSPASYPCTAKATVSVWDTIGFEVPAGYYPNGVPVSFPAEVTGSLDYDCSDNDSQNRCGISYVFHTGFSGNDWQWSRNIDQYEAPLVIDHSFTMDYDLVSAGVTLDEVYTKDVEISVQLSGWAGQPSGYDGSSVSDFGTSAKILDVQVPDEVTWVSASGHFIPEPATIILFLFTVGWALLSTRVMPSFLD